MSVQRPIYLDYHATTPVDPRVLAEMLPYFTEQFGNPASRQHAWGWEADKAVDRARRQIAQLINASPPEIVFTSGASESNNLALKGAVARLHARGRRIVTVATEHKSVLDACRHLESDGFEVHRLGVGPDGLVDLDAVRQAVTPGTILVSVMAANNEIGTLQPLAEIGAIAHERGALFHSDAAQGAGKIPIDVQAMQIDLLSLTGHKLYGPKGCGALFVRRKDPRVEIAPQIDGGGQEAGIRSGTLNVPGIVGLGRAVEICREEMPGESARLAALRDRLLDGLRARAGDVRVNGTLERRLPHNLHVTFDHVQGEALLMALGDLAVSTGSACSSGSQAPSHVLQAIGATGPAAGASIRFGLGRGTTESEVDFAIERVAAVVTHLRSSNPSSRIPSR
ncbi:MAG TPA: aminotransferase class V-fold PLP-dependent enzyme [Vicinamibacterales bacterium]|nr:aminotransferase class V-fold PLP-dependent enzyme [Vicinamibacterales bacterium]